MGWRPKARPIGQTLGHNEPPRPPPDGTALALGFLSVNLNHRRFRFPLLLFLAQPCSLSTRVSLIGPGDPTPRHVSAIALVSRSLRSPSCTVPYPPLQRPLRGSIYQSGWRAVLPRPAASTTHRRGTTGCSRMLLHVAWGALYSTVIVLRSI